MMVSVTEVLVNEAQVPSLACAKYVIVPTVLRVGLATKTPPTARVYHEMVCPGITVMALFASSV
ncbi:MAG: hypothetical protein IPN80_11045 [Flavobacterium sp.]|nr:hypothetical protein [Flavobacterium sp.]